MEGLAEATIRAGRAQKHFREATELAEKAATQLEEAEIELQTANSLLPQKKPPASSTGTTARVDPALPVKAAVATEVLAYLQEHAVVQPDGGLMLDPTRSAEIVARLQASRPPPQAEAPEMISIASDDDMEDEIFRRELRAKLHPTGGKRRAVRFVKNKIKTR